MRNKYLEEKTWVANLEEFDETKFKLFFKNRLSPFIIFLYDKYIKNFNPPKSYDYRLVKSDYLDRFIFGISSINSCKLYCIESEITYEI